MSVLDTRVLRASLGCRQVEGKGREESEQETEGAILEGSSLDGGSTSGRVGHQALSDSSKHSSD